MAQTKKVDVVILGGGASGLMCASLIKSKSVLILEKADRIGKKILVTGNGRCNLTNNSIDISRYNTSLVKPYFDRYSVDDTLSYFMSLGLMTHTDSEGRVYPISDSANSVLDVLRLDIENKTNVSIMCGANVTSIEHKGGTYYIKLDNEIIETKELVLSVGGLNGEPYLKQLNVPYKAYRKSLGAMQSEKNVGLNGVRVDNVNVTLEIGGKNYSQNGEILFKENALSGIVIFNLSAYFARLNASDAYVHINLLGDKKKDQVIDILIIRKNQLQDRCVKDYFTGMLHKALSQNILARSGIDANKMVAKLTSADISTLAHILTDYKVKVMGVESNNQVHTGGVSLEDMDTNLQVKGMSNLYAMGELLDVDAECGGYNLQWAWTSAFVVAEKLNQK